MTEKQATINNANPKVKRIPIQERSVLVGDITGVNGYRANRALLKQRFAEGGYHLDETEHFLLFTRAHAPTTILVHWFAPEEIDANIGDYFLHELKPLGILAHTQDFGDVFGAVVLSLFPHDVLRALHLYGANTLRRYQQFLKGDSNVLLPPASTMHAFAQVYRRVCQLQVGESFLDVGCSFGFLPLLISELVPTLTHVVGADIQTDPFVVVRALAEEQGLKPVQFVQADVLADNFNSLGLFDTVVALHLLEHFSETEMYCALANVLKVAAQRLILAVPYEPGEPESAYGHEQLFSRARLEAVGAWCMQQLGGHARISYEECAGGLLLIERSSAAT